ncbi:MAG: histidinol-phosphate transaminase [Bacteroidales bacterium]
MFDISKVVRKNVADLVPYSSARDEFPGKDGTFMDANENPYGSLNRYPDPYQKELKSLISARKGISEDRIFLGNGSDEIIDLSFRIFCNPGIDKALTFIPTYGMYEVAAAMNDVTLVKIPLTANFGIDLSNSSSWLKMPDLKLIIICSPNNPTGNSMKASDVEYIISNFEGIVLLDEAYIDFSGKESFLSSAGIYPNLIVMHTFSKAMGMAAGRIGIAYSDPAVIRFFNKMKAPYNISTLNQREALRRLANPGLLEKSVKRIKTNRERLVRSLGGLSIVEKVFPTDSNFILVKVKDPDHLYTKLVEKGIIVRNRNSVVRGCIRITVGTGSENKKLIRTLKEIEP